MKTSLFAALAASSALVAALSPAAAQETPAFRVPLEQISSSQDLAPAYSWIEQVSSCSNSCGTGTRSTTYQCQDVTNLDMSTGDFGAAEPAGQCMAALGAAPAASEASCTNYAGCGFDWIKPPEQVTVHKVGDNPVGRPGCGDVQREFDPECRRNDGEVLPKGDHGFCRADLPDYSDVAAGVEGALGYDRRRIETAACNATDHAWNVAGWSSWSSTCSTTAMRTRAVSCYRKFDGSDQADAECPQPKPETSQVEAQYGSCTYSRTQPKAWGSWSSDCSTKATRSRSYSCLRSNGDIVPASACTSRGIDLNETQTAARYGSCTYSRVNPGAWSAWSSSCDANANRSRTYQCRRSNGDIVAASECTSRGIDLTERENGAQYGSCSYKAVFGAWSGWSSDCSGSAKRTRSVSCERSNNGGSRVSNSECTSRGVSLSPTSETSARYGSCSYSRVNPGNWSTWSSSCSASASSSRSYQCRRSDGTIVSGSECTSRGIGLSESRTGAQYGGCSYSAGGTPGAWSSWSSTCSANATRTRTWQCIRSDGAAVSRSACDNRGVGLTEVGRAAVYSGCSYRASLTSSVCSSPGYQTRTYSCRRSDGTLVDGSYCGYPGGRQTVASSACYTYAWSTGAWSAWGTCTNGSQLQTRSVVCKANTGSVVADSSCSGSKPATTNTQACQNPQFLAYASVVSINGQWEYSYGNIPSNRVCTGQFVGYARGYFHSVKKENVPSGATCAYVEEQGMESMGSFLGAWQRVHFYTGSLTSQAMSSNNVVDLFKFYNTGQW